MTCFWDSILTCLKDDDYRFANIGKGNHKHFITQLKLRNRPMESIQWQREKLREKLEVQREVQRENIARERESRTTKLRKRKRKKEKKNMKQGLEKLRD